MLPSSFPIKQLPAADLHKVEWFYGRYVEDYYSDYYYGHFLMAGYAAVPGLLTPDLLYKLWQNFNGYNWNGRPVTIHRIAVADVLLSPLCREVGFELYEMHHDIRLAFLEWLQTETANNGGVDSGFRPIVHIAAFLQEYYQQPNPGGQLWGEQYTETQQLEALSYSDPGRVADVLKHKMYHAAREQRETDLLRTMDAFSRTYDRLKRVAQPDQQPVLDLYHDQHELLRAGRALIQQDAGAFKNILEHLDEIGNLLSEDSKEGVPVKVAGNVMEQLDAKAPPAKLWVLVVGVENNYEGITEESRQRRVNDAHLVAECINDLYRTSRELNILVGEEATQAKILQAISQLVKDTKEQDNVLIYFSCNAVKHEEDCHLRCADTEADDLGGGISQAMLRQALRSIRAKQQVLILEAPFSGSPQWMEIVEDCEHAIIASCTQDQSPYAQEQMMVEKRYYSYFTYELIRQLRRKSGLVNIREWMTETLRGFEVMPQVRSAYKESCREYHRPQLYASQWGLDAVLRPDERRMARTLSLLRKLGYFSGSTAQSGTGDLTTAVASGKAGLGLSPESTIFQLMRVMEKEYRTRKWKPVFLLIFSDPYGTLNHMTREWDQIATILRPAAARAGIELVEMHNRDKADIINLLKDPNYRNRIELFYYSGQDKDGDMVLADGVISILDLMPLLAFQERIQLLITNTCNSKYFAEWVTQMGVRMAIGSERLVTDEFAADFGIQLFDTIIKKGQLVKYDPLTGWTQYISQDEERDKFRLYTAPWQKEDAMLPWDWEKEPAKKETPASAAPELERERQLHAVVLSISNSNINPGRELPYCAQNAQYFHDWLQAYSNIAGVKLQALYPSSGITRDTAMAALELFREARDGDTCVFFYSGVGLGYLKHSPGFCDCVFEDDRDGGYGGEGHPYDTWRTLNSVLEGKKIHLLMVVDFHDYLLFEFGDRPTGLHTQNESSTVILQSPLPETNIMKANNYFMESLEDILTDSGISITYKELFERLRLRLYQKSAKNEPQIWGEKNALSYMILSGQQKRQNSYRLHYTPDWGGWVIDAGLRQGIRPSLHFMRTWFRLEDGRQVAVGEVYDDHSLTTDFAEEDQAKIFQVQLAQNALPKVKIAYDKAIDPKMRGLLNDAIQRYEIYFIDIVADERRAKFIIRNDGTMFYLTSNTSANNREIAFQPVFNQQGDEFEFIKQMEYIAQWQGVLEFDNVSAALPKDELDVIFEVFENDQDVQQLVNPELVTLHYRNNEQPAFKCRVRLPATSAIQSCYVNVVYLDSAFGIYPGLISESTALIKKGDEFRLNREQTRTESDLFPVHISREARERGVQEIYDYVKLFISDQPLDLRAFEQDPLQYYDEITRTIVMSGKRAYTVQLTNHNWTCITIPLKVEWPSESL